MPNPQNAVIETPVLIAGGGPAGLILALELNHHGVEAILVEQNTHTTRHPKMDVTNGRTMELFRRLGIAEEARKHAVPPDHPVSVVWCVRLAEYELARFDYPSVNEARALIRKNNNGSWPLEPYMRISQAVIEPVFKNALETRSSTISIRFGWALEDFTQDADGVTASIRSAQTGETQTVRARYLAGCDGGGSITRRKLGIELDELPALDIVRQAGGLGKNLLVAARKALQGEKPLDGRLFLIHFTSKDRKLFEAFGITWHLSFPGGGTIISQNDLDTWTLHVPLQAGEDPEAIDPKARLFEALDREIDCQILLANPWTPRLALAESYGRGRVFLAGDSAHQYIPTGGYGMNTAAGDAVDLGWKLAAVLKGWGGPGLPASYEAERKPVGHRNRAASARHTAIRIQISNHNSRRLHERSRRGERARRKLGKLIADLGNLENEALGIELGYRYGDSPVVCPENGAPPPARWEEYVPGTWPGARIPSLYLKDGTALFDRLGRGFTLLRFAEIDVSALRAAAERRGVPLDISDIRDPHVRTIYQRDLVLVRPDQHVAWRGNRCPADPLALIDRVRGG